MKIKHLFSAVLGIFWVGTFAQDYDHSIIDNSDYENTKKYHIKSCASYMANYVNGTLKDSVEIDICYYNPQGLNVHEIYYLDPSDRSSKCDITAQYDENGVLLKEFWAWSPKEIDTLNYVYDELGRMIKSCTIYAFEETPECEEFTYENGTRKNLTNPEEETREEIRNDSTFVYYKDGRLKDILFDGKRIISYSYVSETKVHERTYNFKFNENGETTGCIWTSPNGEELGHSERFYKGTLLTKIIDVDEKSNEVTILHFIYSYYE